MISFKAITLHCVGSFFCWSTAELTHNILTPFCPFVVRTAPPKLCRKKCRLFFCSPFYFDYGRGFPLVHFGGNCITLTELDENKTHHRLKFFYTFSNFFTSPSSSFPLEAGKLYCFVKTGEKNEKKTKKNCL